MEHLKELLSEVNTQIDKIFDKQTDPKMAVEMAKEIKEMTGELFRSCCVRYYQLVCKENDPCPK